MRLQLVLLACCCAASTTAAAAFAKARAGVKKKAKKKASSGGGGFGGGGGGFGGSGAGAAGAPVDEQVRKAIELRARTLRKDPRAPQPWLELGSLMVKSGDYAEAERIFRAGAAFVPDNEMLSAAALTFGGDSSAYINTDPPARDPKRRVSADSVPDTLADAAFESFAAPPDALRVYDQADRAVDFSDAAMLADCARRGVVHKSREPLIDPADCAWVIKEVEAQAARDGGWSTARHVQAPTTDIPVSQVPSIREWFDEQLSRTLFPMLAARYPLAIHSPSELRVMDAFVVRYDAEAQRSLPEHIDENTFSFTIALNEGEYEGGGTSFRELRPVGETGEFGPMTVSGRAGGVVSFPGKLRHAGAPVTAGRRYIIPLFCYLDANKSGKRPGYMLDSLGLDVPDTSAAKLSRYASALVS